MPQSTKLSNPAVAQFFKQGKHLELLGHSIFNYSAQSRTPQAPTVLLVHGFPTSSWDWDKVIGPINSVANIEAIDMLGFGFSDKPNSRDYTIHQQADFHQALLQSKGLDSVHLLAHDYGVSVAQELLARQRDGTLNFTIASCCFLNGGLFPETHKALLIQKLLLSPLGPLLNRFLSFKQFEKSFSQVFGAQTKPSAQELSDFWEIINFNDGKHLFHNLITYMRDRKLHRSRWLTALQKSAIPLGLINGNVDPVSGQHLVQRYQDLNCRLDYLKQLPDIGHYPQVEAPDEVSSAYIEFFISTLQSR